MALVMSDLFVDPVRLRCLRRANHNQVPGSFERVFQVCSQICRNRQFFPVPENWKKSPRNFAVARWLACETVWHAVILELLVKPIAPVCVRVTVANESPVLKAFAAPVGYCLHLYLLDLATRGWLYKHKSLGARTPGETFVVELEWKLFLIAFASCECAIQNNASRSSDCLIE